MPTAFHQNTSSQTLLLSASPPSVIISW